MAGRSVTAWLLLFPVIAATASAERWEVIHEESRLGFTATQTGGEFRGRFDFTADMRFSADDLPASVFDVVVDITSVDTRSRDRDELLADPEWFWFEEFPEAYFRTRRIEHIDGDRYLAVADLTIRDHTHEVELPFTWIEDGDTATLNGRARATMEGGLTMDRLRWEVGSGEWTEDGTIGQMVDVGVDLTLRRTD